MNNVTKCPIYNNPSDTERNRQVTQMLITYVKYIFLCRIQKFLCILSKPLYLQPNQYVPDLKNELAFINAPKSLRTSINICTKFATGSESNDIKL